MADGEMLVLSNTVYLLFSLSKYLQKGINIQIVIEFLDKVFFWTFVKKVNN